MDRKVTLTAAAAALLLASASAGAATGVGAYKLDPSFIQGKHPIHVARPPGNTATAARRAASAAAMRNAFQSNAQFSGGLPGIDGIVNFNGAFTAFGLDAFGNPHSSTWYYSYVGKAPRRGDADSTSIGAPLIPVTVELLDADGDQAFDPDTGAKLLLSPRDHVRDVLESPVFDNFLFTSSRQPTQFADAVHRATFFDDINEGWHTLLDPKLESGATMKIPLGEYHYALNADGSCCLFLLIDYNTFSNLLFPPTFPVDKSTLMGAAELAGIATTKRITTFLFPDTYLYEGTLANCCVLGFHGPDVEPGTAQNGNLERFYSLIYASWITPGLFGTPELGLQDVTALSHEMAETFADPFVVFDGVHNLTPWWLSGEQCQDDLEVGDVVESLSTDVTFPIAGRNGFLYHPQNVALLQWFAFEPVSTALGGAYSYPDPGALPALSSPIQPVFDSHGNLVGCNPIAP